MIAYLKGTVFKKLNDSIILMVQDTGYRVNYINQDKVEENILLSIFTSLVIKEDAHDLYGFDNFDELKVFELLMEKVPGVGAKSAFSILKTLGLSVFVDALLSENLKIISSVSGIGKKTAERIVLELKNIDFLNAINITLTDEQEKRFAAGEDENIKEAKLALKSLGYSPSEISKVLLKVEDEIKGKSVEEVIELALKNIE